MADRHPSLPLEPAAMPLVKRLVRVMRLAALFSLAIAGIAVALVTQGDELHVPALIAIALGVGVSVLLAAALMSLILLNNKVGADRARDAQSQKDIQ